MNIESICTGHLGIIACVLLGFGGCATQAPSGPSGMAAAAPRHQEISGKGLTGHEVDISLEGDSRPVLLAFFASWCGKCARSAPALNRAHNELGHRVRIVGVDVDERLQDGVAFVKRLGLSFPIVFDPNLEVADQFGVSGTPRYVLVNTDGRVAVASQTLSEVLAEVDAPVPTVERTSSAMGTEIRVRIATRHPETAEAAIDHALAEIDRIETMMTDWTDTSQVADINRGAGVHPVRVDAELLLVLERALEISELTRGRFDVTYKGAGKLWDFQAEPPRLPTADAIEAALERVGYDKLELRPESSEVWLAREGMAIGLGGIAKGFAVDRAAEVLRKHGFDNFVIAAGGDLYASGSRGGSPWRVGIRHPRSADSELAMLPVSNAAVVTSGDYERFFELNGKRYTHILDPSTGMPVEACRSVTIVAQDATWADGLSTGVFVMGPEDGMALIERLDGVDGVIVDADGGVHVSSGLRAPEAAVSAR